MGQSHTWGQRGRRIHWEQPCEGLGGSSGWKAWHEVTQQSCCLLKRWKWIWLLYERGWQLLAGRGNTISGCCRQEEELWVTGLCKAEIQLSQLTRLYISGLHYHSDSKKQVKSSSNELNASATSEISHWSVCKIIWVQCFHLNGTFSSVYNDL